MPVWGIGDCNYVMLISNLPLAQNLMFAISADTACCESLNAQNASFSGVTIDYQWKLTTPKILLR